MDIVKLSVLTALSILFGFLSGCGESQTEMSKTRKVVLRLAHHEGSVRNFKSNSNLTQGIGTELIKLFRATEAFQSDHLELTEALDTTLTDLATNKVSLNIPLDTSVKLFAYRFSGELTELQLQASGNTPLSFGKSNNFSIKEDTESLTVTLTITANGTQGLMVVSYNGQTSDQGATSRFTIALKTQPKHEVTVPVSSDFSGVILSASNLAFTPLNWSTPQTVTITGINNVSVSVSQNYPLILGTLLSEDGDYSGMDPDDLTFQHKILIKPVLQEISTVLSPSNDRTPSYTFSSSKAGTISYAGSCSSDNTSASSDNNTVTFNALADGDYNNCSITVTDPAGNTSDNLSVRAFSIDTTKPVLSEVTAVSTPTNDNTSSYTFSSSESGSIQFGGSCPSGNTSAQADNNTVTFNALADGDYNNCSITVTDPAGNTSDNLSVRAFTIDTLAPQMTSVTLDNGSVISTDNQSVLTSGFTANFNEPMKGSTMQVNDGSSGDVKINCNSSNTLRLGADNTTTSGQAQCRELAQLTSSDNLSWTTLIRAVGNSNCLVTDNLSGTPSGTCAATLEPGTDYELRLTTGMTDLTGNALESDNTTLFRTRDAPLIASAYPDNGSDNTSVYLAPVFHFDEPMHSASFVDNQSVMVSCNPTPSSGRSCSFYTSYDSTSDNLTLHPMGPWPDNTTITVTVEGRNGSFPFSGVYEAADGIFMASDYLMFFKTRVSLDTGLVAHYTLDNNSLDHSSLDGTYQDGTASGVTLTGGKDNKSNNAYSFDGSNSYISINDPFKNTDNFSISIWVNTDVFDGSYHGFIGKHGDTYRKPGMWLNSSKGLHYDHYSTTGSRYYGNLNNFFSSINTWYHVVWVKKGTESKFYRDGILIHTGSSPSQFYTNTASEYWLGKIDNYWDGTIDEVKIYDRALNQSEIFDLFYSNRSLNTEELRTLSKVYDAVAPVPGDNGSLNISNLGTTSLGLSWTKASDNHTDNSSLQYRVVQSSSDRIANAETALRNGTTVLDWSTNIDNASITSLNDNTTYYFNVIVRDNVGNLGTYQSISAATAVAANLVSNPGNETGDFSGWTTSSGGGKTWAATGFQDPRTGSYCFSSSYTWPNTLEQTIDLVAAGYNAGQLDASPNFIYSVWVSQRGDHAGQYRLTFQLQDVGNTPISTKYFDVSPDNDLLNNPIALSAGTAWHEKTHTFSGYPSGVRYAYIKIEADDATQNWGGNYGASFDDISISR